MTVMRYSLQKALPESSLVEDRHFGEWVRYSSYDALDFKLQTVEGNYVALREAYEALLHKHAADAEMIARKVQSLAAVVDPECSPHTQVIG
jgi:hypothetical protein